jgi:phosphate transport system substrate-binding protein
MTIKQLSSHSTHRLWHVLGVVLPSLLVVLLAATVGCSGGDVPAIKLKGSDTVLPIAQRLTEVYYSSDANAAEVSITGGGSGVGIAALLEGTADIAMSSRDIKFGERFKLLTAKKPFQKVVLAYDALAVCVHPSNPIKQLTREQLELIYTGKIGNWSAVGGRDEAIVVYSRESSSGTHEFFKEMVLDDKEFATNVLMMPATGAIIQSVGQTPGAIGYVGLAYINASVTALAVSYDQGKTFAAPTLVNAVSRVYPIVRPLYLIHLDERQERIAPFMRFALSPAGQLEVLRQGFVPATPAVLSQSN